MKKIILGLVTLLFMITLVGCQSSDDVIKVGMDLRYPPFETVDKEGDATGISVDIANAFGEYIDKEVEIVNLDFSAIIPALESGEIDIAIASMSITEERKVSVDFSDPYNFFNIISLVNKEYATEHAITSESSASDILDISSTNFVGITSQISASIPESYGFDVLEVSTRDAALLEVSNSGSADVLVMSAEVVANGHAANLDETIVVWDPMSVNEIGMAVKKGNTELLGLANEFIGTINQEGGVGETLHEKYDDQIGETIPGADMDFYLIDPR